MVRYLYSSLRAGVSYQMMERVHPATILMITDRWVVIVPSDFSADRDFMVPAAIKKIVYRQLSANSSAFTKIKQNYFQFRPDQISTADKNKFALWFDHIDPLTTSFGVYTLEEK